MIKQRLARIVASDLDTLLGRSGFLAKVRGPIDDLLKNYMDVSIFTSSVKK